MLGDSDQQTQTNEFTPTNGSSRSSVVVEEVSNQPTVHIAPVEAFSPPPPPSFNPGGQNRFFAKKLFAILGVLAIVGIGLVSALILSRQNQDIREKAGTQQTICQDLGAAGDFNVFIFEDMNQSNTDSEGRVAAGGNISLTGYSVGLQLSASNGSRDDLIAGGSINFSNGTVEKGNAVYNTTGSFTGVTFLSGSSRQGSVLDFNAAKSFLTSISTNLKNTSDTGTVDKTNGVKLTGTNSGLNVFSLNASDLASATSLTISTPPNSTAVINVAGTSVSFSNYQMILQNVDSSHVLFNLYEAQSLTISSFSVQGSILAPDADVTFDNGAFEGTLVAESLNGNGQFNHNLFTGCITTQGPTSTPIGTASPSPTASSIPNAPRCGVIKVYDLSWNQISSADLSKLVPGSKVIFAVSEASGSTGTFDKARFTINGTLRPEVTTKKPGSNEFYDEYEIPTSATSMTVTAQIHHVETNDWY